MWGRETGGRGKLGEKGAGGVRDAGEEGAGSINNEVPRDWGKCVCYNKSSVMP